MYSNLSLHKACSLVFQKLINIPLKISELPFALETLHNDVTNEQQAWFRCVSVGIVRTRRVRLCLSAEGGYDTRGWERKPNP